MNHFKFAFFGTPDIASKTLEILKENGYMPSIIVTRADKASGRGLEIHETPVSIWARENKIKTLKPEKLTEEFINGIEETDLNIVVAYGKIIPEILINKPKLGTINIHYSLLPKYRGASPLEACLLNGDKETGVSIQQMVYKLDSGAIINEEKIDIDINDTKDVLRERLIRLGGELLCKIIPDIINKNINTKIQDESEVTFCKKIKKEDGEINIEGNNKENWNKYRAFYGWPGIFFFKNNKRIKITKAKYENNSFLIERVIPEGKKEIFYKDFLNQN
jgi:methionyl-tRNA formyltransferase